MIQHVSAQNASHGQPNKQSHKRGVACLRNGIRFFSTLYRYNTIALFYFFIGMLFVGVFFLGYLPIDSNDYQVRDDGVITASHVKNLVEYGSIGVNPSGERVEAFSTPLQFLFYLIAYPIFRGRFDLFAAFQTYLSAFAIGAIFCGFVRLIFGDLKRQHVLLLTCIALFLTQSYAFFGWHGSGMENPLTHAILLLSVYILYKMTLTETVHYGFVVPVFLATICRVESIFHIVPLLFIFSIIRFRNTRCVSAFGFMFAVIGLWAMFNSCRYFYFGSLFPNTAAANGVFVSARLTRMATLDPQLFKSSFYTAIAAFQRLNGVFIYFLLPVLLIFRPAKPTRTLLVFIATILGSSFVFFFFFGSPRLDIARPISHIPLFILLLSIVAISVCPRPYLTWVLLLLILGAATAVYTGAPTPSSLCCNSNNFKKVVRAFNALKRKHKLYRPTAACPDLGAISFSKRFNIVDLGWLGNPVLAFYKEHRKKELATDYLLEFTQPDFFQIHGGWKNSHRRTLKDKRFDKRYEKAFKGKNQTTTKRSIWIRRDIKLGADTDERRLIDRLQKKFSIAAIEEEIKKCQSRPSRYSCLYVTRTVYRFLDYIHRNNSLDKILRVFKDTKTSRYDMAVLNSRNTGSWYKEVAAAMILYRDTTPAK